MMSQLESQPEKHKKWCRVLNEEETAQFKEQPRLEFIPISFQPSLQRLQNFMKNRYPEEPVPELKQLEVAVYNNDTHQEGFILDCHQNLYIRSFLFHTCTQNTQKELNTLILFFHFQKKELLIDLILDLVKLQKDFLGFRRHLLKEEEFRIIYDSLQKPEFHFIRSLLFVSLLHYPENYQNQLNLIEIKNLKDIYFSQKMKKILNLDQSDYDYIQDSHPWERLSKDELSHFNVIKSEIENNQITIEEYVQNYLENKKILFWCLWTISPFLAVDISRLFSAIHEYKTIKRVYLDMPQESQEVVNRFVSDNHYPEDALEKEIKKIYPTMVNDYAKETLPYVKLLERLQLFKIPQVCIGMTGNELSKKFPYLKDNQLEFEIDEVWEKSIHREMQQLNQNDDQELVIFFYFLKPMVYFHPYTREHSAVETLIHTDPFTGYGPNQCENSLSYYSHYHPRKQQISSFVLPDLQRFSMKNEKVVSFPYKEDDYIRINDDLFNRFYLFNSLLFSGFGGGGGRRHSSFTPSPDRSRIRI